MRTNPRATRLLAVSGICAFTLAVTLVIGIMRHLPSAPPGADIPMALPLIPGITAAGQASRTPFERFGPVDLQAPPAPSGDVARPPALAVTTPLDAVAPSGDLAPRPLDGGTMRLAARHGGLAMPEPPPAAQPATAPSQEPAPAPAPAPAEPTAAAPSAPRDGTAWREGDTDLPPDIEAIRPRNYQREVATMLRARVNIPAGAQARIAGKPIWVFRGAEYRWVVCVAVPAAANDQMSRVFEAVYLSGRLAGVVADDGNRCANVAYVPFPEATQVSEPAATPANRRARERAG